MITTVYLLLSFSINSHVESMWERGTISQNLMHQKYVKKIDNYITKPDTLKIYNRNE